MTHSPPEEIKPRDLECVFCVSPKPDVVSDKPALYDRSVSRYWVQCGYCGARGPIKAAPGLAIRAWNERKEK